MAYKILLFLFPVFAMAASVRESSSKLFPFGSAEMNMIKNPNCKNTRDITDADSIVSQNSVSPLRQSYDCAIDADAASEFAEWDVEDFSESSAWLEAQNCEASISYEGDASDYDFEVYIGSNKVNSDTLLDASASGPKQISLNFGCGDLTNDPKIRITSTDAGAAAINVANLYIGPATNIGSVSQAEIAFRAIGTGATQSIPDNSPTLITNWTEQVDKYDAFASGVFTAPKDGEYVYHCRYRLAAMASAVRSAAVIEYNGSQVGFDQEGPLNASISNRISGSQTMAAGDTLECLAFQDSSGAVNIDGGVQTQQFSITRIPAESEQVFKVGFSGQDWTSYTPVGSITVNVSYEGSYKCDAGDLLVKAKASVTGSVGPDVAMTFSLPTGFTGRTIVDRQIVGSTARAIDSGRGIYDGHVILTGSETLQPYFPSSDSDLDDNRVGTPDANWPGAGTDVALANGDTVTIFARVPISFDSPCPRNGVNLFKNAVTTSADSVLTTEVGEIDCDGSPAVVGQVGDWLDTPTQTAAGRCTAVFKAGAFSQPPYCTFTGQSSGNLDLNVYEDTNITRTSTAFGFRITSGTTDTNGDVIISCKGLK